MSNISRSTAMEINLMEAVAEIEKSECNAPVVLSMI